MTKVQDELSVLYKHQRQQPEGGNRQWNLAQPNLDRKPLTQDQIREESMKFLRGDQRRQFELNAQPNRRGSLFGPKRDQARQKTPPYAGDEEESEFTDTIIVAPQPSQVTLVDGHGPREVNNVARKAASMMSLSTAILPTTRGSVRGSEVSEDMRLLGSMMPSVSVFKSMMGVPGLHVSTSLTSIHGKTLELDKKSLFRIDDWIKMEQKGEYFGKRKHFLRVVNTLDYDEKVMQVSNYQTLHELVDFYRANYNSNAHNYVWKDIWGNTLKMHESLGENGLMDHSLIIDELGLDHFPTILIYFKDGFENEPLMRLDISKPEPDGITVPCRNY